MERLGGFLGLAGKALEAGDAEDVVGAHSFTGDLGADLEVDLALGVDEALAVADVPAEGGEEGVEEVFAELGLVVVGPGEVGLLAGDVGDEVSELFLERGEGDGSGGGRVNGGEL